MQLTFINWLLALLPIVVVLVLMLAFHWSGSRAGAAAWFSTILIAMLFFGAGPRLIAYSQVKAVLLTLDVLYIIWAALLLFHVADEAGAVRVIGQALRALTPDRMMQCLLLGWLFASLLQGMGGFGVPVAVAAPLLVGMGFTPVQAVIMACVGHGWAVNFGSLATSFQTMLAVTNLPGPLLAPDAGLLLGISAFSSGAIVAYVGSGRSGLLRSLPAVAVLGCVMGGVQYVLVTNHLWTLGATGGALAGLIAGLGIARLPFYSNHHSEQGIKTEKGEAPDVEKERAASDRPVTPRSLLLAFSSYAILIVLAFAINLIPALNNLLGFATFNLNFPELSTAFGFVTKAAPGRSISLFNHPGAILLYTSLAAYVIYQRSGCYRPGAGSRIMNRVLKGAVNSSLGIVSMVGLAVVMSHSGMTNLLAEGLSVSFGAAAYPVVSPIIGAIGAFITGSNNNSNVLFAVLQMRTAELLKLSVPLILAGQTAGASLGSIMAPAKVIVGCSTVGLGDHEGAVIGKILLYGMIPVLIVSVLTWLLSLS